VHRDSGGTAVGGSMRPAVSGGIRRRASEGIA
jgi:hypothetical protein